MRSRSTSSRTKLYAALPLLRELSLETRRRIAARIATPQKAESKPLSQFYVDEIISASQLRMLSQAVAEHGMESLIDVPIKRLVPSATLLRGQLIGRTETSTRLFNGLLKNDLVKWENLMVMTPQAILSLRGMGRSATSEVLALAIQKGLRAANGDAAAESEIVSQLVGYQTLTKVRGINGALMAELLEEFVAALPASSLAMPLPTAKTKRSLLELNGAVALGDVRTFLSGAEGPASVQRTFSTNRRRSALEESLRSFDAALLAWAQGHAWDQLFKWVLPEKLRSWKLFREDRPLRSRLEKSSELGRRLSVASGVGIWLPLMSIESVIETKKLRGPDTPHILSTIARGLGELGLDRRARPWEARFPSKVAALPITWLYQYSPTRRMETLIRRFERGGYTNIGHLRTLHPESLTLTRRGSLTEWVALRSQLNSSAA